MRAFHLSVPVLAGAALCAVTGCSPSTVTAHHTVSEYRADAALRHRQMAVCSNDPGTLGATPDCINAQQAARMEDTQSLRQLPPILLPEKKQPTAKDAQGH